MLLLSPSCGYIMVVEAEGIMLVKEICAFITATVSVLMAYFAVYYVIGFLARTRAYPETDKRRRFAIITAARNEERVIGNLLKTLREQDYPAELFDIFCVADNCTDNTASIAREGGAHVYERFDPSRARKGYALEFLFKNIERDHGIASYDAYVFFDADNLVEGDFLTQMNRALESGADVVTGYRMASNFGENFIAAAYGVHFMRSSAFSHRPRALLGLSTHIAGTGFAVKSDLLTEGWKYFSLTEDTDFTMSVVSRGKKIAYCEEARFYDEQPTTMKIAVRQRLRWQKGRLVCFFKYSSLLIKGVFTKKGRKALSCYDMFFYLFPKSLFNFVMALVAFFASLSAFNAGGVLSSVASAYASFALIGALTVVRELKNIPIRGARLVWYVLLFPWFDLVALPLSLVSLCMRVKWKPIPHEGKVKNEEKTACR